MSRLFVKIAAMVFMLGVTGLIPHVRADEASVQPAPGGTESRLRISRDQSILPVMLDFAKILTFDQPARTVVIGNPAIVDGTLSDEYNIVLTGKAVGATNMIVLGEAGREIVNLRINVVANARQVTTVYHGSAQQVYSCVDTCRLIGVAEPKK